MKLASYEVDGAVWQTIKAHCEARLVSLRKRLENPANTDEALRTGQIHRIDELKKLLAIGDLTDLNVADAGE